MTKKLRTAQPDPALRASGTPVEYHGVMLALSKARAARYLLTAATDEHFPWSAAENIPGAVLNEHVDWIRSIAEEALQSALDQAEGAYRQLIAARWPEESE